MGALNYQGFTLTENRGWLGPNWNCRLPRTAGEPPCADEADSATRMGCCSCKEGYDPSVPLKTAEEVEQEEARAAGTPRPSRAML